jgi:hypothetical protein
MAESMPADEAFDPSRPRSPRTVRSTMENGSRRTRLIARRTELERVDRDGRMMAMVSWARSKVDSGRVATENTVGDGRLQAMTIRDPQIDGTAEGVADG